MKKMKNAKQFENLKFYLCQVDCEHLSHTVRFLPIIMDYYLFGVLQMHVVQNQT